MTTEGCVVCHTDTGVPDDLHIDHRPFYIEGVGQVCETCYYKTSEI
jgi:hypothetical protein